MSPKGERGLRGAASPKGWLLTKFRLRHVEFLTRGILFDHVVLVIVEAAFLLTKAQEFGDFSLLTSD